MPADVPFEFLKRRWIIAWVGVFLVLLVVLAPASAMDWCVRQATGGRIGIAEPAGSFWSGSGYVTALQAGGDAPIRWRITPYRLLIGQLRVSLFQGASAEGTITLSPGELRLAGVDIAVPASLLGQAWEPLSRAKLAGEARVRAGALLVSGNEAAGTLRATLTNAMSGLVASRALGSYEFTAVGADRKLGIELKTLSGPLSVSGSGSWSWGQTPAFAGSMSAAPDKQSELAAILSIGGAPNSAGAVELLWPPRR